MSNKSRSDFLPFAKPTISEEEIAEVVDCLRSGWITTGPKTKKFETMLAEYCHAPHALCVNSATAGLQLALLALGIGPGDEVITSAMTFVASLNVIELTGATTKLVDVERGTYNMDVAQLEAAITNKTKAIMPVHFAGLPVDLDKVYALAEKYNLRVIEDAAHSIGTAYKGKRIGSFGDIQVFSFHPNKNMTTGEGGCIITRDDDVAKQISILRFHGIDRDAFSRFGKSGSQHYEVVAAGYKYNMLDMQAALGIHQLPRLDDFIAKRTELAKNYQQLLQDNQNLILPSAPQFAHKNAWHLYAPLVNTEHSKLSRDEVMEQLKNFNIGTGLHYRCPHLYPYYRDKYQFKTGDFPNAEYIGDRIFSLPLFPLMTEQDQQDVVNAINAVFEGS